MQQNNRLKKLTRMGMLVAISIALVYFIHFPFFPAAPFLEYDPADVPIFLTTFLYGPGAGLVVTGVASVIQGLTVSASGGPIGILMHFLATGSFVLVAGLLYRKKPGAKSAIVGMALGVVTMTVVMCLCNLVLTPLYTGTAVKDVVAMLIPIIIPFNLLKGGINAALTYFLYRAVFRFLKEEH